MPRPPSCRRVAGPPWCRLFKPAGIPASACEELILGEDELEAIRLADLEGLDELSFALGIDVQPVLVAPSDLEDALRRHYTGYSLVAEQEPVPMRGRASNPTVESDPDFDDEEIELALVDAVVQTGPHAAGADGADASLSAAPPALLVRALAELLVEKGLVDRDEIIDRLNLLGTLESDFDR